ncbi:MAG TPA: hypothetical protein VJ892_03530 [Candidatus Absconditabacterales bacterium]|nr:hypothetical protein [Candidatus Absconditabacterales bacterium]
MALILGFLSIVAFIAYFYAIGFWYIGFIPLLVFLISIIYYISGISFKSRGKNILQKYGLFLAWIIILLGLFGVLKFFAISDTGSLLFLVALNIVFWIGSYIFKYNDGKSISQVGYYSTILALLFYIWITTGFNSFFLSFTMFWGLTLAIISFVVFLIGIKNKIEEYMKYKLFVFILGALGLALYQNIENIYIFLLISVISLSFLYSYIHYVLSKRPPSDTQAKEISVRRILAGERVLKDSSKNNVWSNKVYSFVDNIPIVVRFFLEGLNIIIIILLIYLYFKNALSLQGSIYQIFYRLITFGFITNVFLLKKINYTSTIQRLLTFVVINFAIYISLFSAFQGDIGRVVFLGIVRNVICAMMVFHIHKTKLGIYLKKIDYLFWIFTTIVALVVNVVLLFHTQIVSQLLFPIILLYAGIQGMALFYAVKYINKIQEIKLIS